MLGTSILARRFTAIMARVAPYAAAASAALILWHAARDRPAAVVAVPAPLVYPSSGASGTTPAATSGPGSAETRAFTSGPGPAANPIAPSASATSATPAAQEASVVSTIEIVVGRNDTMDAIFRRMALDKSDLAAIRNLPGIRQSVDFLKPGDAIKVTHSHGGEIKELSRKVSDTQTLDVVRGDQGFAAKLISNPVETRVRTATARIQSSLFQAAETANVSDMVALKLAEVFAWDIDFVLDIREGDRFTAVYQQIYQDGRYVRDGDLLAAEFTNDGKVYRAVRFTAADGSVGYYTPQGNPMRKAFLRAPVDFTRVSSGFNPARRHPILNLIRGHMGTDYAAPTGTPIHAAGEGRVSFEGTRGGYGNAILLAHSAGISTLYGHMSRFAKGIHMGSHVSQGEIIGYVGMTGLATGPHLHYEYLKNGVHMDPQTVRLPGAEPLRAESLVQFRSHAAPLLVSLSSPAATSPASIAPPNPGVPTANPRIAAGNAVVPTGNSSTAAASANVPTTISSTAAANANVPTAISSTAAANANLPTAISNIGAANANTPAANSRITAPNFNAPPANSSIPAANPHLSAASSGMAAASPNGPTTDSWEVEVASDTMAKAGVTSPATSVN